MQKKAFFRTIVLCAALAFFWNVSLAGAAEQYPQDFLDSIQGNANSPSGECFAQYSSGDASVCNSNKDKGSCIQNMLCAWISCTDGVQNNSHDCSKVALKWCHANIGCTWNTGYSQEYKSAKEEVTNGTCSPITSDGMSSSGCEGLTQGACSVTENCQWNACQAIDPAYQTVCNRTRTCTLARKDVITGSQAPLCTWGPLKQQAKQSVNTCACDNGSCMSADPVSGKCPANCKIADCTAAAKAGDAQKPEGVNMTALQQDAKTSLNRLPSNITNIPQLVGMVISFLVGIIGSFVLLFFVYAGFLWMTARGNSEKTEQAKSIFVWTSLGLVVMFSAYMITTALFTIFQ